MSNTFQHQVCYSFFIRLNIASDCDWWPRTRDPLLTILDVYEYLLPVMSICLTFFCQDKLTHSVVGKKTMPHWSTAGPHSKVPTIKEGYFATFEKPLEIMRCRPYAWCPGGTPGRGLQVTIWKRSLFVSTKSGSWKKCGVCLHFESPELIWAAGTCAGGLLGEPCAVCPDGKTWWGEACEDCQFSILYWLGALLLALLCLPSGYFIANVAVAWMHLHSLNS